MIRRPPRSTRTDHTLSLHYALPISLLDDLGTRIVSGELAPGTVLTLAGLETRYLVSRTVIREAVRVLEAMGMLRSRRRVGVTVQQIGRASCRERVCQYV